MSDTVYTEDQRDGPHQGAVYSFVPVPWLEAPLWLLREVRLGPPNRSARPVPESEAPDAFRNADQKHEEEVMARAKRRFAVVLSNDTECSHPATKHLVVAPVYSVPSKPDGNGSLQRLRNLQLPGRFYLPKTPEFPQMSECYIDLRRVQPVDLRFLQSHKEAMCLSSTCTHALLQFYKDYLSLQ